MKNKTKKQLQLGMNPSTASHRLVKDILWKFVSSSSKSCYKCGKDMCRETFSIEHVEPWLDSTDPVGLYFDLDNIKFTHLRCNVASARKKPAPLCGTDSAYSKGCRCASCKKAHAKRNKKAYCPSYRKERYEKNEKK